MLEELAVIHPDPLQTQAFWDACARRELRVQRCTSCQAFRFPPMIGCRECGGAESEWVQVSGRGHVFTFTIVVHPALPQVSQDVPYGVVVVALDDAPGVRLISNVLDCPPDELHIDMAVELVWDEPRPGLVLPRFRRTNAPS